MTEAELFITASEVCFCLFFFLHFLCFPIFRKAALLFGWAVFLLLAYKVSKLDREYQEYNPYEVLNLDPVNARQDLQMPFTGDR